MRIFVPKSKGLKGAPPVYGDRSFLQRAIFLGSIFPGFLSVRNVNPGSDTDVSVRAMRDLGKDILMDRHCLLVHGGPIFSPTTDTIELNRSGYAARVILGLLSAIPHSITINGDDVLKKRSMRRVTEPLTLMGAKFSNMDFAPITVTGSANLKGIEYTLNIGCSHTKTAILIAALFAQGKTILHQKVPSRTYTEDLLEQLGYPLKRDGLTLSLYGRQFPSAQDRSVINNANDASAAAFWVVAALLIANSEITISNIQNDPFRLGFLEILKRMGANVSYQNGCILAKTSLLHSIEVDASWFPYLVDEYLILFVAASLARGTSVFYGIHDLQHAESNQLEMMRHFLTFLGINAWVQDNNFFIEGNPELSFTNTTLVDCSQDHRVVMALSILGAARQGITVEGCENVSIGLPGFFAYLGA